MLDDVPDTTYTHGHHESVLRSHRWRTAANSAAYLLPHLAPGADLLDVGCGPGTVTCDLARSVAPGRVVGIDAAADVVDAARAEAGASGVDGVTFEVADLFDLPFDDGTFDIVHAHQVLQHVADPVAALVEMRRVCRPGGLVAVRDSDYPTFTFAPPEPDLDRAVAAYGELTRVNRAHWDAGRQLLGWAHAAGFVDVVASASAWCFASEEERAWWGGLWADRFTRSALADQLLASGIAQRTDLEEFAAAWRRWAASPDGWFAVLHGEVLATA
ncbi:MAG: methyltransferase domain-containing protein [Acidimicrobiales bacterium]|jgi:SAM-dependent methyltransferase